MLKKAIQYETFDGETVTGDFYFHLSKAELTELELTHKGGFSDYLNEIIASEDGEQIVNTLKKIIMMSYGQKSVDGRKFIKNDVLREDFMSTDAYSELFMELATSTDGAVNFIRGVMPSGLVEASENSVPELATAPPVVEPAGSVPTVDTATNELDYEAMLAQMPDDVAEVPKRAITQREHDFMKGRLTPTQFDHFMSTRFVS